MRDYRLYKPMQSAICTTFLLTCSILVASMKLIRVENGVDTDQMASSEAS